MPSGTRQCHCWLATGALTVVSEKLLRFIRRNCTSVACQEISGTDQGCGFCKEKLARLFEPFFTTKKQGMGIGLSICKTSIEAHGGRVTTENSPNRAAATFHDRRRNPQAPSAA